MSQENKVIHNVIWPILAIISLSAIVLIKYFSPYIPDYDGLSYFDTAKTMNGWLFNPTDFKIAANISRENFDVTYFPITNTLSVFIAALFLQIIDTNLLPALINSLYLFLFSAYLTKIKSVSYACIATLLLCSHTLFFRLFTTLTSEFSVGLWIFAFLLTLISNHARRGVYLVALTILGILLRTVDIVFILMAVSAYTVIHYALWKNKQHIFITLRYVGLCLLLTAPLFFQHYKVAFEYVLYVSYGETAAAWKAMGGTSGRYDLFLQYVKLLTLYNPLVIPTIMLLTAFGLYSKGISRRAAALVVGISFSVCIPLLMASSLNIQVVFWVYTALIFVVCELGFLISSNGTLRNQKIFVTNGAVIKNVIFVGILLNSVFFLARSWSYEVPYLRHQSDISKIASDISEVLDNEPGTPTIATNYAGVGPLNELGLSWHRADKLSYGGIGDIYSKDKNPADYLKLKESTQFFIAAHENYFFPPFLGINDRIKETHHLFAEKSSALGFRKVKEISRDGRSFDIWYRPGVQAHLQYASSGDNWISWRLPLEIGSEKLCSGDLASGTLNFSVNFPNPNLPGYAPPFLITVRNKDSEEVLSSAVVNKYGEENIALNLKNVTCGKYELSIDKAFSTKADQRELSAQFIKLESSFKFDSNQKANK